MNNIYNQSSVEDKKGNVVSATLEFDSVPVTYDGKEATVVVVK